MKIYIKNGESIPAVKVQDDVTAAPSGYTEVTDILGIAKYGAQGVNISTKGWYDKKCVRDKIKIAVYTKMGVAVPADTENQDKWDLLTAEEKSIAAHWFCVRKHSFQDEVLDDTANNRRYWKIKASEYREWTIDVRRRRLSLLEAVVFVAIQDIADSKVIMGDLDQIMALSDEFEFDGGLTNANTKVKLINKVRIKKLGSHYKNGLQSQADDGTPALRDFINSEIDTPFAGKGFREYTYTTRGSYTIAALADELLEIIDGTW